MDKRYFSEKVVEWYEQNQRKLPWRENRDPYRIWLSEIILQQTRVNQGLPYYQKFIEEFPTVRDLAQATEQKVLRLWQGLGYYSRARNLHKCAKEVVKKYQGLFPDSFEKLKSLPGIGDYTAAAIASIAFHEPVAVVDGNVFRVLSRIYGIDTAINSPQGKKIFSQLANELVHLKNPGGHNQAVMEFGALHCKPQNPFCEPCVFNVTCFAASKNLQHTLPVKIKGKTSRKRYFYYIVVQKGNSLLMKKREQKDIWQGLYDFHLIEKTRTVDVKKLIADVDLLSKHAANNFEIQITEAYRHVLTHQVIHARFIIVKYHKALTIRDKNLKFFTKSRISALPKPVLVSQFLEKEHLS
jgi:A/G-specific adenine glycosylase